ncbi:hypothetical protein TNCV_2339441 [Trichonephila clavipes]|nr:hypothetical protein TNCV_2339441 [Trichonephila clavipes]
MDDNATCHRTLAVQDCLDSEGIQRLVWPARSPDLNPIENVWDALGRQVAGRNCPPTNKNSLIRALTEEWDKLPQQLLDNVVQKEMVHVKLERPPVDETWKERNGVPAQVSSLSLDPGPQPGLRFFNVALESNTRVTDNGSRHFEPRNIFAGISPNY